MRICEQIVVAGIPCRNYSGIRRCMRMERLGKFEKMVCWIFGFLSVYYERRCQSVSTGGYGSGEKSRDRVKDT